jgi:hypothetical protein
MRRIGSASARAAGLPIAAVLLLLVLTAVVPGLPAGAQTATPYLGAGRPVVLNAAVILAPGDAIAPHLYAWYFDGVDDRINLGTALTSITNFTALIWVAIVTHKNSWLGIAGCTTYTDRNWWILLSVAGNFIIGVGAKFSDGAGGWFGTPGALTWVHVGLSKSGNTVKGYYNGTLKLTSTGSGNYVLDTSVPVGIGARNGLGSLSSNIMVSHFLFYSQALSDSEVYNVYAYNTISTTGLSAFLDPTFYNGTHYLDLSGYGKHGVGYGGVARILDSRRWLYVVRGLHSDGYVHLRYFPIGSRVEVYDSRGSLVATYVVSGTPNAVGLVADFPVSLPAGTYTVKVYTYVDYTIYQNSGTTYTTNVARYPPSSAVRLAVDVSNVQAIRYQVATDSTFSSVVQDVTVLTALNYVDATLPSSYGTYYVRVSAQLADGSWTGWSNTYTLKVDALQGSLAGKYRLDVSGDPSISYSLVYATGDTPLAMSVRYNAMVVSLYSTTYSEAWWRVDVYSGATTAAEPPNPSYYTYKGTARPLSTHSYFASSFYLYLLPTTYSWSYVLRNFADWDAPYWAKAVGGPSINFALVYQSLVYLPQSGTYTFEVYSDKGVRLYVNGTLLIDGWSGKVWPASASTTLNAGWYNVTVKMWQSILSTAFLLGLTLPNGTVVRPLRPVKGIQMAPPPGGTQVFPATPFLLTNYVITTASGSVPVSLGAVGAVNITLVAVDGYGFSVRLSTLVVFDAVRFRSIAPTKQRFTVGEQASLNIDAFYAYDGTPFQGSVAFNDTLVKTQVGRYAYGVISVSDSRYGLAKFYGNTTVSIIFDKLVVDVWFANAVNRQGAEVGVGNGTRVDYRASVRLYARLRHAYDDLEVTSGSVSLGGVPAAYSNGYWVATLTTTAVGAKTYTVVSSAQAGTGASFVDASPKLTVVWDALAVDLVSCDVVLEVCTVRLRYAADGTVTDGTVGFLGANTTAVVTSGGLARLSVYRLEANITSPHVAYGVSDASGLVWSKYRNATVPIYKLVFDRIRVKADNPITLLKYVRVEGLRYVKYETRGSTAINVTATAVLVNGRPYPVALRYGHTVLTGLSSTVEVYCSPAEVVSTSYASAPGFDVEVGLASNSNVSLATFKAGVLINSTAQKSRVFAWYNGTTLGSKDMAFPSPPTVVLLSYYCESSTTFVVYAGFVYAIGNYTRLSTAYLKVSVPSCPASLHPYVYSPTQTVYVERYGATLGLLFRLLVVGELRVSVVGPLVPGSMLKYVYVSAPLAVEYALTDIRVYPYGTRGLTLRGFRGWTLSYSVSGVTVSGISVASDEFVVDVPLGVTLVVTADPVSRTISIVSAAPPPPMASVPAPPPAPGISVPDVSILRLSLPTASSLVMYGVFLALAVAMYSVTRSLSTAVLVSGVVASVYAFAVRDLGILPYAAVAIVLGVALHVSSRD